MIDFANLKEAHKAHKEEIEEEILRVCRSAHYIMGQEVESLEEDLAHFSGSKYAITCSSGSSALLLALMALGIKAGDEVITTPFTLIATAEMIALCILAGRKSVFAQYTLRVRNRENLQEKLKQEGIPSAIHYPLGLHLQECFGYLGYKKGDFPNTELASKEVLSLPMNPYLTPQEIQKITQTIQGVING
ncbi:MAG: aminotransferase class I/II-fold pyridoxal phosphate-dependent enzyme [Helicobacter sp.]|nr:aminotransferase class I/II-fold pyridoxal phosphate-dependent enzyme [Helicobacter sp.]